MHATPDDVVPTHATDATPGVAVSHDALRAALQRDGLSLGGRKEKACKGKPALLRLRALCEEHVAQRDAQQREQRGLGLKDVLTPETVGPLLADAAVRARLLEVRTARSIGTAENLTCQAFGRNRRYCISALAIIGRASSSMAKRLASTEAATHPSILISATRCNRGRWT